jgi:hypothetical protein
MDQDREVSARFELDGVTNLESVTPFPQNGLFVLDGAEIFVAASLAGGSFWGKPVPAEQGPVAYLAQVGPFGRASWLRRYDVNVSIASWSSHASATCCSRFCRPNLRW